MKLSERSGFVKPTVRIYPDDKGLKQPVRDYDSTFSAVAVLKEMFFKKG